MINLNLISSEIFISLTIMFLLIFGVYKKNSSQIVFTLSIISLFVLLALNYNLRFVQEAYLFQKSYIIDYLSTFMKMLVILSGIFVMSISIKYLRINNILKIEYPILILCSILGMMVMIS